MFSNREYQIVGFFIGAKDHWHENIKLNRLLKENPDEFEYIFALQERIDDILDLKVGECIYIRLNRDNEGEKGIISRIS